ncbi:MAG: hypothetical protein WCP15_03560 [bacterium]
MIPVSVRTMKSGEKREFYSIEDCLEKNADLNHEIAVKDLIEYILSHLTLEEAQILLMSTVDRLLPSECACEESIAPMKEEEVVEVLGRAFEHIRQIMADEEKFLSIAEAEARRKIVTN